MYDLNNPKLAIIGAGVSGLSAAWALKESKNLSQKNPELIETILKKMDKFDKDLKLSQRSIGKQ